jgi:hypothetical protein
MDDVLHPVDHPVLLLVDPLATLDVGSPRPIEHKEREKRSAEEAGTTEEQSAQLWILALLAICRVEEPDRGVDADAHATPALVVALEAIHDSEVGERTRLAHGPYDLELAFELAV